MIHSKQAAFNVAYIGLKSQNFALSQDGDGDCLYLSNDGTKCAIGHMIPNDMIDKKFNSHSVNSLFDHHRHVGEAIFAKDLLPPEDAVDDGEEGNEFAFVHFLERLQSCHDMALNSEDMHNNLVLFASEHGLTIPNTTL